MQEVFERIQSEFNSEYKYKYDLIRNLIFELLHFALKLKPSAQLKEKPVNASRRIAMLFMELLERQFPIDDTHQRVNHRSAFDFADQLNVHVNHLNRAVKETYPDESFTIPECLNFVKRNLHSGNERNVHHRLR